MKNPVLVIMAAGMGSRYGGMKQMDPIDEEGHLIIDFSLYDAVKAGFKEVIFIIKKENEADFRERIGDRISDKIKVTYVYQEMKLPDGFAVPAGRAKPFGTGHAILSCIDALDAPFAVINADDYYGSHAFKVMYDYLVHHDDGEKYHYAMVGYILENTLTDNGFVSRGVCRKDEEGHLIEITEHTHIEKRDDGAAYTEDDGATWHKLPAGSTVSMNMWGFQKSMLQELKNRFPKFLERELDRNPLKCEFFLPSVVGELLEEEKVVVDVLMSTDRWYGVTYQEDKQTVVNAIRTMKEQGIYPQHLWN